jgi:hypothetical protein
MPPITRVLVFISLSNLMQRNQWCVRLANESGKDVAEVFQVRADL